LIWCNWVTEGEILLPLKTEGIWENFKKWYNSLKSGRISKIMVPPESLSQYLSNEYQCDGVSMESSNYQYFFYSDFGDKSRPLSFINCMIKVEISQCYGIVHSTRLVLANIELSLKDFCGMLLQSNVK
jgi:hypothetical protein